MTKPLIFDLSNVDAAVRAQIMLSPKLYDWFTRKPKRMLGVDRDAKTIKGQKRGYKTAILYLAPAKLSGQQVCPMAELAGCTKACLFTAGRGAMSTVMISRLWRTLFWQQYQSEAIAMLKSEIAKLKAKTEREGFELLVRLNGTSDIRWENYGIVQAFPDVQFYDYTKLGNRKNVPSNYDLTFSYSGTVGYAEQVSHAKANGMRIAAVFRHRAMVKHMLDNGETFLGLTVVDGDDTDIRHLDPHGSVVALYAKGKAKLDKSGFVVG